MRSLDNDPDMSRGICYDCKRERIELRLFDCAGGCGKKMCLDCGYRSIGGIHICSKECEDKYIKIYMGGEKATHGLED